MPFKAFMDFGSPLSGGNADLRSSIICVTDSWLTIHIENKSLSTPFYICCVSQDKKRSQFIFAMQVQIKKRSKY